jgi:hypothetical protein
MAVCFYSIDAVLRCRLRSNLFKKFRKGLKAKLNTPAAVCWIAYMRRIGTSRFGFMESAVFGSVITSLRVSMYGLLFKPKAATGAAVSSRKATSSKNFIFPTIAAAQPVRVVSGIRSVKCDNGEPAKLQAGKINEVGGMLHYSEISHVMSDLHRILLGEGRNGIHVPSGSFAL